MVSRSLDALREPLAEGRTHLTTFPLEALPPVLRHFTEECAASLPVPHELVAVPGLAVMGAAIGNARGIELKPDWRETPIIYAAVISQTGTMKSPALAEAVQPIQALSSTNTRSWTADVTVERLAVMLRENPKGLLSIRDELTAWVKSMNQYKKGGQGSDQQFYLSAWSGSPIRVDRKALENGKPTAIEVPRPFLSVVGCLPPDMVQELDQMKGLDDGFLARILFTWPDPIPGRWSERNIPLDVRESYANRIQELFALPYEGKPHWLPLAPDAKEQFAAWVDQHYVATEDPELSPFLRAAYAKLKGYCARLAVIHALGVDPMATSINTSSVTAACQLIEYFKTQAVKVAPAIGSACSRHVESCKWAIRRHLSVCRLSKRDLQRKCSHSAEIFNEALKAMSQPEVEIGNDELLVLREHTY